MLAKNSVNLCQVLRCVVTTCSSSRQAATISKCLSLTTVAHSARATSGLLLISRGLRLSPTDQLSHLFLPDLSSLQDYRPEAQSEIVSTPDSSSLQDCRTEAQSERIFKPCTRSLQDCRTEAESESVSTPDMNSLHDYRTEVTEEAIQRKNQQAGSAVAISGESTEEDLSVDPAALGCTDKSISLSDSINTQLDGNTNMCIQEPDTSLDIRTTTVSYATSGGASGSEEVNVDRTNFNRPQMEANESANLLPPNTDFRRFEEPLQRSGESSSQAAHAQDMGLKELAGQVLTTRNPPQHDNCQVRAAGAETAVPTSSTQEDTLLTGATLLGHNRAGSGGIRRLFQQISSEQRSVDADRPEVDSCSPSSSNHSQATGETNQGDVVLVTGGCGFLGQHIVKLLNLRAPHVAEIRVLDLMYFEKRLDYQTTKQVKSLVGDISNSEFVHKALQGVHSVIHVAGLVSWGTFPDHHGMERVNVKGTLNVLNACLENNVQRLVYCSTVDVAVGKKPIRAGTEENTPLPDQFLFPGYPETKFHGERILMGGAAHLRRRDGGQLQTVILRPNVLYGELDKYYVTNALRMAKKSMGILYQIGNGKALFQQAYVGNAAWAFVCADLAMRNNPDLTQEVFYIPDNTPVQNSFSFMLPYLKVHGLKLSQGYLSYALSHSFVAAAETLARLLSPVTKVNLPVQSCTIAYINTDLYFCGDKAQRLLNYQPIYTPEEARDQSMKYYARSELLDETSATTGTEGSSSSPPQE